MGNSDPEEGGDGDVHPHPPHVLGYGSVRRERYSAQQQGTGARTYALQPISLSVPNPSMSGPRMHEYEIRAGGAGAPAVQVAPGSLSVRTPVMAPSHAVIGGSTMAASASASASVPRSVLLGYRRPATRIARVPPARRAVRMRIRMSVLTPTLTSTTETNTFIRTIVANDGKSKIARWMWRGWRRVIWMRREGGLLVFGLLRVRWEEQQHPVQRDAKGVHHRDAFQANNGVAVHGASVTAEQ